MRFPDISQSSSKRRIGDIEVDEGDIVLDADELTEDDIMDEDYIDS
ncbi:MAG: hypothetical protein ABIH72_00810 [archaeon]